MELQKAANQGRRCSWEKLSAIKANCAIELALDECVALLNHMRRLKRSAERAVASQGQTNTFRFNASRRIPSWNCIARENSAGSLEEDGLVDAAASVHQGTGHMGGQPNTNSRVQRNVHDGNDSESDNMDLNYLNSWTRCGGPLMRTASANKFINFVQSLELEAEFSRPWSREDEADALTAPSSSLVTQMVGGNTYHSNSRVTTPDRSSENTESELGGNRVPVAASTSIMVSEGDMLQAERINNGIMFNVVKKEDLLAQLSSDSEQLRGPSQDVDVENVQMESCDACSDSESVEDDEVQLIRDSGSCCDLITSDRPITEG